MPITEEQFKQVQAANPGVEIEILQHDRLPDEVIARVPTEDAWRIYRQLQADGKKQEAIESLVSLSVLLPDAVGLRKMVAGRPALVEVWAGEIVEMAGFSQGARRKKF